MIQTIKDKSALWTVRLVVGAAWLVLQGMIFLLAAVRIIPLWVACFLIVLALPLSAVVAVLVMRLILGTERLNGLEARRRLEELREQERKKITKTEGDELGFRFRKVPPHLPLPFFLNG